MLRYETGSGMMTTPPMMGLGRRSVNQDSFTSFLPGLFKPVAVENPGGSRITNKRDPSRADVVTINGYRGKKIKLHHLAAKAWRAMVAEARTHGILAPMLEPVSGYRSTARQKVLFRKAVKKYGSKSAARQWVAPPGRSAHHSGRAIDLHLGSSISSRHVKKMRKTDAWKWLNDNAERFGFYPYKKEPWHWEYNPPVSSTGGPSNIIGNFSRLPTFLSRAIKRGGEFARVSAAIANGERDENKLASQVFFARHPERKGRKIQKSEKKAAAEWINIRNILVRPLLSGVLAGASLGSPSSGTSRRQPANQSIRFKDGKWGGWKGLQTTSALAPIDPNSIRGPFELAVAATSDVEGSYDKVQTYDRGILSWGIKQWTLHQGSLQGLLSFIQKRLNSTGKQALWNSLFPGMSIRGRTLYVNGRPYDTKQKLMKLIRNKTHKVEFDPGHMKRWMTKFAIAGQEPVIQRLQMEYATQSLKGVLRQKPNKRSNGRFVRASSLESIGHYLGNNGRAIALFQSMYTQVPAWAKVYVGNVARKLGKKFGSNRTQDWPSNWRREFVSTLEEDFKQSGVACWGLRARAGKAKCSRRSRRTGRIRQTRYEKTVSAIRKFGG